MSELQRGWSMVKFGHVVHLNRDTAKNPEADGIERYVGLEHISPGDPRVRSWGDVAEGTTFTNRFRPGQVLFGKRRAYQRKVAVADFEGVCSGDIYVLEPADSNTLHPDLLPFICQSEAFFERAVGTSAGSLSPRTNWKSLAAYEFSLPPMAEQERLVDLLSSAAGVVEAYREALEAAKTASTATLHRLMSVGLESPDRELSRETTADLPHPAGWTTAALSEVASVQRGRFSHRPRNLPKFFGGPYPFAQTGDVGAARGRDFSPSQYLSDEGVQYSRSFQPGSILITIAAVIGATAITTTETWCPDSVVGIEPSERVRVDFLEYALRYRRPYLEYEVATQTAQKNINLKALRPLRVPVPPLDVQDQIVEILRGTDEAVVAIEQRLRDAERLSAALLNRALGGAL